MSKRSSNFPARVLSHKKFRYQEGKEDDVEFMCSNGSVTVSIFFNTFSSKNVPTPEGFGNKKGPEAPNL